MAGEIWRRRLEVAKEVTWNVDPGASTRNMYALGNPNIGSVERTTTAKQVAIGSRVNTLGHTAGPDAFGGQIVLDMSADEIIEAALISIKGGVTPTTPGGATNARLWTFVPGNNAPDSMTARYNDGANAWVVSGIYGNTLTIAGSTDGDNTVTVDLFAGSKAAGSMTGGLADRTPTFMNGWQAQLYIDDFGDTPGTTAVVAMRSWSIPFGNNLQRKMLANNVRQFNKINTGLVAASAQVTLEASVAAALTEYTNFTNETKRLYRFAFLGPADGIETGFRPYVYVDVPGTLTQPNTNGDSSGSAEYQFTLEYDLDPTNAFGYRLQVQNARTTAWGET